MVGLQNVDNTTDLNKPISTATQTALTAKENPLSFVTGFPVALVGNDAPASISRTGNVVTYLPAIVTAGTVGLQNVTNESKATMFSSPTFTGTITHTGLLPQAINTYNGDVFQIDQFWSKTFGIFFDIGAGPSSGWYDVLVAGSLGNFPLVGGSYMLSIFSSDNTNVPYHYNYYYTGVFSWMSFPGTNDADDSQLIPLHGYGHASIGTSTQPAIQLRTLSIVSGNVVKLQILPIPAPTTLAETGNFDFTMTVRRLI